MTMALWQKCKERGLGRFIAPLRPLQQTVLALLALLAMAPLQAKASPEVVVQGQSQKDTGAADQAKMTSALLEEANQAYQEGKYQRALDLYEVVEERGVNGYLFFNMGNAYERLGHTGPAIQHYLIAQLYLPRDGNVRANLSYARERVVDRLEPEAPPWMHRIMFWHNQVSDFELIIATLALNALFWGLLTLVWFRKKSQLRWMIVTVGILTVLAGATEADKAWRYAHHPVAVVLGEEISVRSGTDVNSVRLFLLHAGTEVRVGEERATWARIELPDGKRGWVERRFLGIVRP